MADCNETLDELHRFLDREVDERLRAAIQAHLAGCSDCLSAFDFHAELRMVIAMKCQGDPVPDTLIMRLEQCLGVELNGGVGRSDPA
jgi:mycothiol system anti-sigma-R factor